MNPVIALGKQYGLNITPSSPKDKRPVVKGWQNTTLSSDEIKKYENSGYNLGFVCGPTDNGRRLVVIDFDDEETFNFAKKMIPPTLVVDTGPKNESNWRGKHVYLFSKTEIQNKDIEKNGKELLSIRAKSRFVVGPGAAHPSGLNYEIALDKPIETVGSDFFESLYLDVCQEFNVRHIVSVDLKKLLKKAPSIGEKSDNAAIQVASGFRKMGLSKEESKERIKEWWRTSPSYINDNESAHWLESKIESAFRPEKPYGYFFVQDPKRHTLDGLNIKKKHIKKSDDEKEEFKASNFASLLSIEDYYACMRDTKELYIYKEGIYIPGDSYVHEKSIAVLLDESTKHKVNEILFYIQATHYKNREDFDENPYVLNLKNGLYDIYTKELSQHSPFYLSLSQLQVEYNENAECPAFLKFLEEVLPEEEDRNSIQEWFGYCLFKDYRFQEILVLVGSGRNGKSTLLRTLIEMIGSENISSVTLKSLSEDKFAIASLFNRYANVVADLPNEKIMNTGNIKSATGGDSLAAQRKFGHEFTFINHAKFIFSCNEVPEMKDDSDANYRRWNYIDFLGEFEGDNDDKDLIDKLTTKEEMEGLLKWSLIGLDRLLENGKFSNNKTLEERREETIKRAKSVHYYAEQSLEPDGVTHIEKSDLYENYIAFCKYEGIMPKTKTAFGREISEAAPSIRSVRRGEKGGRYTAWSGVKYIGGTVQNLEKSSWCHTLEGTPNESMTPCQKRDEKNERCHRCHTFLLPNYERGLPKNDKKDVKIDDFGIIKEKGEKKCDTHDSNVNEEVVKDD